MKPFLALLLAAFAAPSAQAAEPLSWRGSDEIAAGGAERGPWRMNESRWDYVDDPSVAIDERGEMAVVWVDQARKDVFFQRFSAAGAKRGEPVNVSRTPAVFSWLPRIALSPRDPRKVFVLWQEIIFSGGVNGGAQGLLMRKLAVNGSGAVAIVNSTFKPNEHTRVWLIRGSL